MSDINHWKRNLAVFSEDRPTRKRQDRFVAGSVVAQVQRIFIRAKHLENHTISVALLHYLCNTN